MRGAQATLRLYVVKVEFLAASTLARSRRRSWNGRLEDEIFSSPAHPSACLVAILSSRRSSRCGSHIRQCQTNNFLCQGHRARSTNALGIGLSKRSPYFIKQYPAFSEESHQSTPSLKATVGVRYYKYRSERDSYTAGLIGPRMRRAASHQRYRVSEEPI
jgi:hypothetical protein